MATIGTGAQVEIGAGSAPTYSAWTLVATNLFTNPSFEGTGSIPAGASRSTDWALSGSYSLYVPSTSNALYPATDLYPSTALYPAA